MWCQCAVRVGCVVSVRDEDMLCGVGTGRELRSSIGSRRE